MVPYHFCLYWGNGDKFKCKLSSDTKTQQCFFYCEEKVESSTNDKWKQIESSELIKSRWKEDVSAKWAEQDCCAHVLSGGTAVNGHDRWVFYPPRAESLSWRWRRWGEEMGGALSQLKATHDTALTHEQSLVSLLRNEPNGSWEGRLSNKVGPLSELVL